MSDRLSSLAERRAHERVATPIILKVQQPSFLDFIDAIRPLVLTERGELFPRLRSSVENLIPDFLTIPKFSMMAGIFPREIIFDLAQTKGIERIYADERKFAFAFPVVSSEGVFSTERGVFNDTVEFTSTAWTRKAIGADIANEKGYSGQGVTVVVTDTGAHARHEQLYHTEMDSAMIQQRDLNGHGTWCTACVGGKSALDDRMSRKIGHEVWNEGMAPEARLVAVKCLGWVIGSGSTSQVIKSVEMATEVYEADVISMSLGSEGHAETPEDDPEYEIYKQVVKEGAIPVVAAGNSGPDEGTLNSPGYLPDVLTVGAYDPISGELADFSSRGPTPWGDVRPDCIAPGVNINSACTGLLDRAGDQTINKYSFLSGTSMATPHVAGLVALFRQAYQAALGKPLYLPEIKKMLAELGTKKNNNSGHGAITWQMFEDWMQTQHGIVV